MSEEHRHRAVEWFLVLHELPWNARSPSPNRSQPPKQHQHRTIPSAPLSTTPYSPPKKASGTAQDGQDEDDTPDPIHTFWPITRR